MLETITRIGILKNQIRQYSILYINRPYFFYFVHYVPTFNLMKLSFRVSFMLYVTVELHLETLGSRML